MSNKRQAGVTLIELIVAIVIVGVALAGMVAVFTRVDRASVDPVIGQQMAIIAEGMMDEILFKEYGDLNQAAPAQRAAFTRVTDYAKYAQKGIVDVEGNPVPGLADYSIAVTVAKPVGAQVLQAVPAADTLRIEVVVSHPGVTEPLRLVGWRTRPALDEGTQ